MQTCVVLLGKRFQYSFPNRKAATTSAVFCFLCPAPIELKHLTCVIAAGKEEEWEEEETNDEKTGSNCR